MALQTICFLFGMLIGMALFVLLHSKPLLWIRCKEKISKWKRKREKKKQKEENKSLEESNEISWAKIDAENRGFSNDDYIEELRKHQVHTKGFIKE